MLTLSKIIILFNKKTGATMHRFFYIQFNY